MKYRHKHTGQVVAKGTDGLYHSQEGGYTLQRWIFENSNDWEEVKEEPFIQKSGRVDRVKEEKLWGVSVMKEEPNYLITAFRAKDGSVAFITKKMSDEPMYGGGIKQKDFLKGENSIEDGQWEIFKVKNSLGEEFTIGDVIKRNDKDFKLISFAIHKEECYVIGEDKFGQIQSSINLLRKPKSPLYTTTDGVDIYEGDRIAVYLLHKGGTKLDMNDRLIAIKYFSKQDKEVADRYLTFTSEENRDKYIKENSKKFLFTTKDGVKIYNEDTYYLCIGNTAEKYTADENLDWTEEDNGIRFYDKEQAEEYIKSNRKPIFVSADGKEYYNELDYSVNLFSIYIENWEENRLPIPIAIKEVGWIHFSTEEARQEYIDNNKPKYSLQDFRNVVKEMGFLSDSGIYGRIVEELKKLGK